MLFHGFLYNFTVSPSILETRSLTSQGRSPSLTWTFDREVKLHWSQSPGGHISPQEGQISSLLFHPLTLCVPQAARSFFSLFEEKAGLRFCQRQSLGRGVPNLRGGIRQGFPQRALKKHKEKAFLQTESLKGDVL